MTLSLAPWKEDVINRLRYGGDGIPGFGEDSVFREGPSDEDQMPRFADGTIKPYVSVWFGQRVTGGRGHKGITGVRNNAHEMHMMVVAAATDGRTVDRAVDLVSELLLGFRPANQGELEEDGMQTIRRPADMSGIRTRYAVPIGYSGTVDI